MIVKNKLYICNVIDQCQNGNINEIIMENLKLQSIEGLKGQKFFIPDYQRGYKWEKDQVEDLLNDIYEFMLADKGDVGESYCIQPLVVGYKNEDSVILNKIKECNSISDVQQILTNRQYEVIDGQQRLTTIYLILGALGIINYYNLEYATRSDSAQFLNDVVNKSDVNDQREKNEDYYHIFEAFEVINKWFDTNKIDVEKFKQTLLKDVKFIWYLSSDPNPINVFRRLNDGKIGLTDAELIKAMVLHGADDHDKVVFERASEWDLFENMLQDDEFWLFIQNEKSYSKPTRIEFIFDWIRKYDLLNLKDAEKDYKTKLGNDNHKTFRYFYLFFQLNKEKGYENNATLIWRITRSIMSALSEWFNDLELYHYIGYLVLLNSDIVTIYKQWNQNNDSKTDFLNFIKSEIKSKIKDCSDLSKTYDNKSKCLPLLLLHNIEEVLNQNRGLLKENRYGMVAFYRFPFHLYKKERDKNSRNGWEIEHIASNSGDADDEKNRRIYLEAAKTGIADDNLIQRIDSCDVMNDKIFNELKSEIEKLFDERKWDNITKNKIWNFTILDSGTNQEYHNSVFPFKRLYILNKEIGKKTKLQYNPNTKKVETDKTVDAISFIPPITKKIFTKSFTKTPKSLNSWTLDDAKIYLYDIVLRLQDFLPECYKWLKEICLSYGNGEEKYINVISEFSFNDIDKTRLTITVIDEILDALKNMK